MLNSISKYFDEYSIKARIFPCFIILLPLFFILYIFFSNFIDLPVWTALMSSSFFILVILFILSDIARNLGKILEEKIFDKELGFPTTYLLLHSNQIFSVEKKELIYKKILLDFKCTLCNKEEENYNPILAKQKIKEVVGLIRQKVQNGRLLLQYNIRYGFWRNLSAVAPLGILLSLVGILFAFINSRHGIVILFFMLGFFYSAVFFLRGYLLKFFGEQYAEQIFLEYYQL